MPNQKNNKQHNPHEFPNKHILRSICLTNFFASFPTSRKQKTAKFHPFLEHRIRIVCGSGSGLQVLVIICRPLTWPPAQSAALPGAQCTALDEFKHVLWGSLNVLCLSSTKIKWTNQTLVLPIPIALSETGIPDKMFPKFISLELVGSKINIFETKKRNILMKIFPFDKTFHICCI